MAVGGAAVCRARAPGRAGARRRVTARPPRAPSSSRSPRRPPSRHRARAGAGRGRAGRAGASASSREIAASRSVSTSAQQVVDPPVGQRRHLDPAGSRCAPISAISRSAMRLGRDRRRRCCGRPPCGPGIAATISSRSSLPSLLASARGEPLARRGPAARRGSGLPSPSASIATKSRPPADPCPHRPGPCIGAMRCATAAQRGERRRQDRAAVRSLDCAAFSTAPCRSLQVKRGGARRSVAAGRFTAPRAALAAAHGAPVYRQP